MSLGDLPAGEGLPAVAISAIGAFLALALIFAVLFIMDKIHEKNCRDKNDSEENDDEGLNSSEDNSEHS